MDGWAHGLKRGGKEGCTEGGVKNSRFWVVWGIVVTGQALGMFFPTCNLGVHWVGCTTGGGPMVMDTGGRVSKMASSRSPKLKPLFSPNCKRRRLNAGMWGGATCSNGEARGPSVGSVDFVPMSGLLSEMMGKFTPKSMLPDGLTPRAALKH